MTAIDRPRPGPDPAEPPAEAPTELVFVTAEACHLCDRAREVLDELRRELPFTLREVDLDSPEGRALLAAWRFPFPPALGRGGTLIAFGRFSLRHLRRVLGDVVTGEP